MNDEPSTMNQLDHDVLNHSLSVKQADYAVGVAGIVLRVCYHYDGCSLFVQIGKQFHNIVTVAAVQVTGSHTRWNRLCFVGSGFLLSNYGYQVIASCCASSCTPARAGGD